MPRVREYWPFFDAVTPSSNQGETFHPTMITRWGTNSESKESFSTRFSSFRKNRVDEKRDLNSFLMGKYEDVDEEIYRATSSHFVGSDIRIITTRDVDL